ncbi:MAG: hypothetical protein IPJ88_05995 [Myxococcales bacterium]|nr:MAG: hypothetical protein IPJ88_05995 [Myxococcales bacterium]
MAETREETLLLRELSLALPKELSKGWKPVPSPVDHGVAFHDGRALRVVVSLQTLAAEKYYAVSISRDDGHVPTADDIDVVKSAFFSKDGGSGEIQERMQSNQTVLRRLIKR